MTRINLLSKEVVAKRKGKKWGLLAGAIFIGIVFILGILYVSKVGQLKGLEKEIARIDQEIAKFKNQEAELEGVKGEKTEVTKRLEAIKQLVEKDRQLWSHLLEEMSESLPEGVWLRTMSDLGQERLSISAVALDNFAVAHYMVNLMQNAYFEEVELKNLTKSSIDDYDIRDFNLTCRYNREVGG